MRIEESQILVRFSGEKLNLNRLGVGNLANEVLGARSTSAAGGRDEVS